MTRFRDTLLRELRRLLAFNASERPWEMPLAAAVASGLPVIIGASYGQMAAGLAGSIGGLAFLYLPATRLSDRMAVLMACAFGLVACFALGILSSVYEPLTIPVLALIAAAVTMICRFYAVGPPGSLFFVMTAAIGAYSPARGAMAAAQVGFIAMGCTLAVLVAFFYSLHALRHRPGVSQAGRTFDFGFVVADSVVIGAAVGLSLVIAQLLQLPRPYWVPVSCLAVIQAASLGEAWRKQLHRIAGTILGLLLFLLFAMMPLSAMGVALLLTALTFVIETLVVRNYAFAVVFITPLTILLAEAANLAAGPPKDVMVARLFDTVIGCLVGVAAAACLHSPHIRNGVARRLRRILP
ncbi:FUSC family protein [Polaromonas sp.]|uniref:FUSC family protein n=1 Tax=Polaromonas sp. TaxID=1869339 RepID=UPI003BAC898E